MIGHTLVGFVDNAMVGQLGTSELAAISLGNSFVFLAMSFGKPVIAPRLGGIVEVLGEANDLLYDPEDKDGLLKGMQKSTNIDLDKLSELVEKACDRLDWNLIGQDTVEVYRSVTQKVP